MYTMDGDKKITRTQRALRDALRKLVLEKHYDDITVEDILICADVGRSTFYAHYRGKDDLFRRDWESFLQPFIQKMSLDDLNSDKIVPIEELFQRLKNYHSFYRALTRSGKMSNLIDLARRYLSTVIEDRLTTIYLNGTEPPIPISILSDHLASQTFSLLRWWLDNDMPYSAEQMDEIFHQLVSPGIRSSISNRA